MTEGGGARENQREVYVLMSYLYFPGWGGGDHGGIWRTMHCRLCMDCYGTFKLRGIAATTPTHPAVGSVTLNAKTIVYWSSGSSMGGGIFVETL